MKHFLVSIFFLSATSFCFAQDANVLLKEAQNLEIQLKEAEALDKYKAVLTIDPKNVKALVKAAELNVANGSRQKDKKQMRLYYESALAYAQRALDANANDADALYAMAMASGRMTDVADDNKKIVAYVKDVKLFSDKALAINPNHGKANYTLGKWHYEMVTLSGFKKAAVKLFYGGLPDGDIEKAISYMEKCRMIEPYFVRNYFDLAKAYEEANRPAKMIDVLQKLVKLPVRTADDAGIKAAGQELLNKTL